MVEIAAKSGNAMPPKKSIVELCSFLETKVTKFADQGEDYLSTLAQHALDCSEKIAHSEINPIEFFTST